MKTELPFTKAELAQARRMNMQLLWMPRFRAPGMLRKLMIQSAIRASQVVPHGVPGITTRVRRISWRGHEVSLRILTGPTPPRGVYIDYHGGGWSIGSAAMDDRINARLAAAGLAVVSVDYGLLPEMPFVRMVEQCHAAADYVMQYTAEFGAGPIFIGGESAGAHLAACTLLRLRERADFGRIAGAVLFYGVYDLGSSPSVRAARAATLVLHGPSMQSGIAKLLPDRDEAGLRQGDYSPLFADLKGLPPVLLICGTIDPLIDDSTQMADALRASGVEAQLVIVPDAPHAFNRFPTRVAERTNAHVRGWIDARLDQQTSARAAG